MKLLTRLLRMRRPAGSVAEEAALSEIHMELLKEEYNTGELKLNIHRIPGTGIEVVVGENPTVMFTAHVDTVHRDIELQDISMTVLKTLCANVVQSKKRELKCMNITIEK